MKRNNLMFAMFTLVALTVNAAAVDSTNPPAKAPLSGIELEISNVRHDLKIAGYSDQMMNDLFGEGNHYFPTTPEKLESAIFMVDLLITEGRYRSEDKQIMIFLAFDAHKTFTKKHEDAYITTIR